MGIVALRIMKNCYACILLQIFFVTKKKKNPVAFPSTEYAEINSIVSDVPDITSYKHQLQALHLLILLLPEANRDTLKVRSSPAF